MMDFPPPPWAVAADETPAPDGAEFRPCDELVGLLAAKTGAKVQRATYTTSRQWGLVMRATLAPLKAGGSTEPRVTCWGQPGGKVNFWVDYSGLDKPLE